MRKYIVFDVQKKGQPALGVFSFEYSPKIVNQQDFPSLPPADPCSTFPRGQCSCPACQTGQPLCQSDLRGWGLLQEPRFREVLKISPLVVILYSFQAILDPF